MLARFALLLAAITVAAPPPSLAPFTGHWQGHTRGLVVRPDGTALESIWDGCCDHVVDLRLRLSRPRRIRGGLAATVTATFVRVFDRSAFTGRWHAPRTGERGTIRLRHDVITESISGIDYCGPRAKPVCGA